MNQTRIFELDCGVMNYDWGQVGEKSLVAQLSNQKKIDQFLPYAELWMGIHPKCPSRAKDDNGIYLSEVFSKDPSLLGDYVTKRWGELPFLLKILSVAKPLSIQAHPDRTLAGKLHAKDPEHYPDDNHKPEIALALSDLDVFYGLDHQIGVDGIMNTYAIMGDVLAANNHSSLRQTDQSNITVDTGAFIKRLLLLPQNRVDELLKIVAEIIRKKGPELGKNEQIFLEQYSTYPGDIGLIISLFMNFLQIETDDALYLDPYQLHAYLQGNLAECMANSDNVIRAGMTNKFKDLDVLEVVIDKQNRSEKLPARQLKQDFTICYQTPAEEFEIHKIEIPKNQFVKYSNPDVPEILIILSGTGKFESAAKNVRLGKGTCLFVGANNDYAIEAAEDVKVIRGTVPYPGVS